ncbi:hypothetical protein [Pimelobacter sp. 30-1]|uniref:hypothetical protein n=1 Tax=Pimelobacter sp. 30-1 TaxID=2004991 RepID=UPI001C051FE1|nr:hypothetical protein [Pimelobacter sp. 30-1]MBU2694010.1 hypothetical protein [Pimelobacter sp. 30-1]
MTTADGQGSVDPAVAAECSLVTAARFPILRYVSLVDEKYRKAERTEVRCPGLGQRTDRAWVSLVVPDEATETTRSDLGTGVDERRFLSPRVRRG